MSECLSVNPVRPETRALDRAVAALARGRLVVYPTDTLYGLGADPTSAVAVARLVAAKRRPPERAVPLIASDMAQVEALTGGLGGPARRLAECWWPGPLTLIVRAAQVLAPGVCGPEGSVAIRVPANAVARAIAERFGGPITSTSANRSDEPAPASVSALSQALVAEVAVVLDAGVTAGGLASTIVDCTGPRPILRRPGPVAWSRVLESLDA